MEILADLPAGAPGPVTHAALANAALFATLAPAAALAEAWPSQVALAGLRHGDEYVRWASARCAAANFGLGDAEASSLARRAAGGEEAATRCELAWRDAVAGVDAERSVSYVGLWGPEASAAPPGPAVPPGTGGVPVPRGHVRVGGLDVPCRGRGAASPAPPARVVRTASIERVLSSAVLALCQSRPLLLEGPPGSGKSLVLQELASVTGNLQDLVRVHLDDQMDSKSLLGTYACTSTPGEFVWQPGPLAQAVQQGRWLLVEDINLAPPEVLAALVPLLEARRLHLPQRAEVLHAAPGFQLLASVTSSPAGGGAGAYGSSETVRDLLGGLVSYVTVPAPGPEEEREVLTTLFPSLGPLVPHVQRAVMLARVACGQVPRAAPAAAEGEGQGEGEGGAAPPGPASLADELARVLERRGVQAGAPALHMGRHFSVRDAVKICRRVRDLHGQQLAACGRAMEVQGGTLAAVPQEMREACLAECMDALTSLVPKGQLRVALSKCLADLWALDGAVAEHRETTAKPAMHASASAMSVGRVSMSCSRTELALAASDLIKASSSGQRASTFARTGHTMRMLEKVAAAVRQNEPVLLVGETGTGKTTLVQQVADAVGVKLAVLNLSQQTDASDLLGGFKPVEPREAMAPLVAEFPSLVRWTWSKGDNEQLLHRVARQAERGKWGPVLKAFRGAGRKVVGVADDGPAEEDEGEGDRPAKKQKKSKSFKAPVVAAWSRFLKEADDAERAIEASEGGLAFAFVEGALVKAVKNGWWLLLDEINLAPAEALERVAGLLDMDGGSVTVVERGDAAEIARHPSFRLLSAMNPATDSGKRDLPAPLRNRFTEVWVDEPTSREDLQTLVAGYLHGVGATPPVERCVDFYLQAKAAAAGSLSDGAGHRPAYSLRALSRALMYVREQSRVYGVERALYDGFSMAFQTLLSRESAPVLEALILKVLLGRKDKKGLRHPPAAPQGGDHVLFDTFWVEVGPAGRPRDLTEEDDGQGRRFVLTPSVREHLRSVARAVLMRSSPVLLQGPTSSGKTSLVAYLAAQTGHTFVRINNHDQIDLQEYLGSYVADETGRLVFREGALVQAVRHGHWLVLDELNLAPTEVLEALNRLLDDNRELFVPELGETIKPHPHFLLFATQNPPGAYAGRKVLSKAFRSRFLELHIDDIPDSELSEILEKRCGVAPSYAAKMIEVMRELQRRRQGGNVFGGKQGLITPRDLFRWAERGAVGYQQLAEDGFCVLGERLRADADRDVVREVLQDVLRTTLDPEQVYDPARARELARDASQPSWAGEREGQREELVASTSAPADGGQVAGMEGSGVGEVVWTPTMRRMFALAGRCLHFSEPCLLVGETGTGKTTVCQVLAAHRGQRLRIVNCNQHTEAGDFLGGYRPVRDRESHVARLRAALDEFQGVVASGPGAGHPAAAAFAGAFAAAHGFEFDAARVSGLVGAELGRAVDAVVACGRALAAPPEGDAMDADGEDQPPPVPGAAEAAAAVKESAARARAPFEWVDGPLVEAMRAGDMILVDELNLADDAVLERLNSVLEPSRTVTLAEKGGGGAEVVVAHPAFRILATMNPGGDHGKKELSPALQNRFTAVWVPSVRGSDELRGIVSTRLHLAGGAREQVTSSLLEFWAWFQGHSSLSRVGLSVRDLLVSPPPPSLGPVRTPPPSRPAAPARPLKVGSWPLHSVANVPVPWGERQPGGAAPA